MVDRLRYAEPTAFTKRIAAGEVGGTYFERFISTDPAVVSQQNTVGLVGTREVRVRRRTVTILDNVGQAALYAAGNAIGAEFVMPSVCRALGDGARLRSIDILTRSGGVFSGTFMVITGPFFSPIALDNVAFNPSDDDVGRINAAMRFQATDDLAFGPWVNNHVAHWPFANSAVWLPYGITAVADFEVNVHAALVTGAAITFTSLLDLTLRTVWEVH